MCFGIINKFSSISNPINKELNFIYKFTNLQIYKFKNLKIDIDFLFNYFPILPIL